MAEQHFYGLVGQAAKGDIWNLPEGVTVVVCLHVPLFWALAVAWIYAACC